MKTSQSEADWQQEVKITPVAFPTKQDQETEALGFTSSPKLDKRKQLES